MGFWMKLVLVPYLWETEETYCIVFIITYIYVTGPKEDRRESHLGSYKSHYLTLVKKYFERNKQLKMCR